MTTTTTATYTAAAAVATSLVREGQGPWNQYLTCEELRESGMSALDADRTAAAIVSALDAGRISCTLPVADLAAAVAVIIDETPSYRTASQRWSN